MPKKAKRVASRQAQLSQRGRHKGRRHPTGQLFQTPPKETEGAREPQQPGGQVPEGPGHSETAPQAAAAVQPATPRPAPTPARPAPRSEPKLQQTRAALEVAPYVKRELTRISILGAVVIAVLVALTFVLR